MWVLDATFLIDYLAGHPAAGAFLRANEDRVFVVPAPAYAEVLVGEANLPDGDVATLRDALGWVEVYAVDGDVAALAAELTTEIDAGGPFLTGIDGIVAAVGRALDAPVVTCDGDLTHEAVRAVVDVEPYRE